VTPYLRILRAVLVLLILGGALWLLYRELEHYRYQDFRRSLEEIPASRLVAAIGLTVLSYVVLIGNDLLAVRYLGHRLPFVLLRPAVPRSHMPEDAQWEAVSRIVAASPYAYAHLALLGDKMFLLNDENTGFVMYAVKSRSWVALGDPVGPPSSRSELVWRFQEMCDQYAGKIVFYRVSEECLPLYLDLGLTFLKVGEEARVALADLTLEGASWGKLRHTCSRCQRLKCVLEVIPGHEVSRLLPQLRRISDAWLAKKGAREKAFSLGYFDEAYLQQCPIACVRRNGRIIAFANILCGVGREELSADLMRYAPDAPNGVMDFLFVELMLWGKQQGYRWFNLGMAPLSGLEDHALDSLWERIGLLLFRHGEHFYNFQGLRQYKEKFATEWRSEYLALPGGLAIPQILLDIARLINRGGS